MKRFITAFTALILLSAPSLALDTIYLVTKKTVSGTISGETPDGVKVRSTRGQSTIPTNQIDWIKYDKQSAYIQQGRLQENGGKYEDAIQTYEEESAKSTRKAVSTTLAYYIARSKAKLAMSDSSRARSAVLALEDYLRKNPGTLYEYDAQRWLGEVHLINKDMDKAKAAFEKYAAAPFEDYKLRSKVALGRIALNQSNYESALRIFDEISKTTPKNDQEKALSDNGKVYYASTLAAMKKYTEAEKYLIGLVKEASKGEEPDEGMLAVAYCELGDVQRQQADSTGNQDKLKEALISYLRVDVLYNTKRNEHARALYWITKSFQRLGDTPRATQTYTDLRRRYPTSEWGAKAKEEMGG